MEPNNFVNHLSLLSNWIFLSANPRQKAENKLIFHFILTTSQPALQMLAWAWPLKNPYWTTTSFHNTANNPLAPICCFTIVEVPWCATDFYFIQCQTALCITRNFIQTATYYHINACTQSCTAGKQCHQKPLEAKPAISWASTPTCTSAPLLLFYLLSCTALWEP